MRDVLKTAIIIDSDPVASMVVRYSLEKNGYNVLYVLGSLSGALEIVKQSKPTLLFIDAGFEDAGAEFWAQLKHKMICTKAVFMFHAVVPYLLCDVYATNVSAIVSKNHMGDLADIIRMIDRGIFSCSEALLRCISDYMALSMHLSSREKMIFKLFVKGHTNERVSDVLNIDDRSVRRHRSNIIQKLGRNNFEKYTCDQLKKVNFSMRSSLG